MNVLQYYVFNSTVVLLYDGIMKKTINSIFVSLISFFFFRDFVLQLVIL